MYYRKYDYSYDLHFYFVYKIGMQDVFGESGSAAALLEKYRLDAKGVYEQAKEFLGQ